MIPTHMLHIIVLAQHLAQLDDQNPNDGVMLVQPAVLDDDADAGGAPVADENFGGGVPDGGRVDMLHAGGELEDVVDVDLM